MLDLKLSPTIGIQKETAKDTPFGELTATVGGIIKEALVPDQKEFGVEEASLPKLSPQKTTLTEVTGVNQKAAELEANFRNAGPVESRQLEILTVIKNYTVGSAETIEQTLPDKDRAAHRSPESPHTLTSDPLAENQRREAPNAARIPQSHEQAINEASQLELDTWDELLARRNNQRNSAGAPNFQIHANPDLTQAQEQNIQIAVGITPQDQRYFDLSAKHIEDLSNRVRLAQAA